MGRPLKYFSPLVMLLDEMKPKSPRQEATPALPSDTDAKEAARAQADKLKKKRGAASTIATGPQGVDTQAPVLKRTLGD